MLYETNAFDKIYNIFIHKNRCLVLDEIDEIKSKYKSLVIKIS